MILYSLRCGHDHTFDEWFDNSGDYDTKAAAGALACPECGDSGISKAIMAPRLSKGRQAEPSCSPSHCGMPGMCPMAGNG